MPALRGVTACTPCVSCCSWLHSMALHSLMAVLLTHACRPRGPHAAHAAPCAPLPRPGAGHVQAAHAHHMAHEALKPVRASGPTALRRRRVRGTCCPWQGAASPTLHPWAVPCSATCPCVDSSRPWSCCTGRRRKSHAVHGGGPPCPHRRAGAGRRSGGPGAARAAVKGACLTAGAGS